MAQDLHGRKTRLEDSSDFYDRKEQKSEKETFRSLHGEAKRVYFFDYIFPKLAVGIIAAAALAFLIFRMLSPKKTYDLYAAVLNAELTEEEKADLEADLVSCLASDRPEDGVPSVMIDDGFRLDAEGMEKLQVYLANGQIDLILAPQETYRTLAGYGLLVNLQEILTKEEESEYRNLLLRTPGYLDDENLGFSDSETSRGESLPYGIRLPEGALTFVNITDQVEDYGAAALGGLLTESEESRQTESSPAAEDAQDMQETAAGIPYFAAALAQNSKHPQETVRAIAVLVDGGREAWP